jgi:phospholipid/cholesterol/gamma-HCH transport system substrate-binding protein
MTSAKVNLTLVGAFVLAGAASLVIALALLAGRSGPTDRYYTFYSNVAGLKYGSQVLYEGYPVGQVEQIDPVQEKGRLLFRVHLSVTRGWQIPEDSIARSEATGLLAPQTVAIAAGRSAKMLAPGGIITPGATNGLMSSVNSIATDVDQLTERALVPLVENLNQQVSVLGAIIDDDVRPLVHNTNKLMASAATQMPQILENANAASANLARISDRVGGFLDGERVQQLERMTASADQAVSNFKASSDEVREATRQGAPDVVASLRELRLSVESLSRRSEAISQNLETSTRNLQEFSREIRQSPGALLRRPQPRPADGPEAHEE